MIDIVTGDVRLAMMEHAVVFAAADGYSAAMHGIEKQRRMLQAHLAGR